MDKYRCAARDHICLHMLKDDQINRRPDLWMYGRSPAQDHMRPLSAEITNIIHDYAQKILDATVDTIRTRMDRAPKQGDRHLTYTKQDYEDADNSDYQIAEHRVLGIIGHHRIKEKDTQAKMTSDEYSRRPTNMKNLVKRPGLLPGPDGGARDTLQEAEQKSLQLTLQEQEQSQPWTLLWQRRTVIFPQTTSTSSSTASISAKVHLQTLWKGRGNARRNAHPEYDNVDEDFFYDWFQNKKRERENRRQGKKPLAKPHNLSLQTPF